MLRRTFFAGIVLTIAVSAQAQQPNPYGQAVTAYNSGDYAAVEETLGALIEDGTTDARIYYYRGMARFADGKQDDARADFAEGARLEADGRSRETISRSLERVQGPVRQMLEQYRREARQVANLKAGPYRRQQALTRLYGQARAAYFKKDYAQSRELLDKIISDDTVDPRVFYYRGLALKNLGKAEESGADFARAVELESAPANRINVDRALEAVQGEDRKSIEGKRSIVLAEIRQKQYEVRKQMIAAIIERRMQVGPGTGAIARSSNQRPPDSTAGTGTTSAPPSTAVASTKPASQATTIDTSYLPAETEIVLHVRVSEIWNSPLIRQWHDEDALKAAVMEMQKATGLTPSDVESLTVGIVSATSLAMSAATAGPQALAGETENVMVVVRTRRPFGTSILNEMSELFEKADHDGKTFYRSLIADNGPPSIYLADGNTLVMGDEEPLKAAIDQGEDSTPRPEFGFVDPAKQLSIAFAPADPFALMEALPTEGLGSPAMDALAAAVKDQVLGVGIGIGFTTNIDLEVALLCVDDAAATGVNTAFAQALTEWKGLWDLVKDAAPEPIVPIADSVIRAVKGSTRTETFAVSTRITQQSITKLAEAAQELGPALAMSLLGGGFGPGGPGGPGSIGPGGPGSPARPTQPPPATKQVTGLQIAATAQVSSRPDFDNTGNELPKAIELALDVTGPDAKAAGGYGFVTLTSAKDNNGADVKLRGAGVDNFGGFDGDFVAIDREDFFVEHPEDGCRVVIRFEPGATPPTSFASAEGTFKLRIVEESNEVVVDTAASFLGKPVASSELTAAGYALEMSQAKEKLGDVEVTSWVLKWTNPPNEAAKLTAHAAGGGEGLQKPEIIDADGNVVGTFDDTSYSSGGGGASFAWSMNIDADNPIPADAKIRFRLNTKVAIADVPFKVADVAVKAGN